jgi:hypothetical protein
MKINFFLWYWELVLARLILYYLSQPPTLFAFRLFFQMGSSVFALVSLGLDIPTLPPT